MKLVVIHASRGSKRIPRNNTNSLCDKPVIKRSIEGALLSGGLDRIIASTATGMVLASDVEMTEGQQKGIPTWS